MDGHRTSVGEGAWVGGGACEGECAKGNSGKSQAAQKMVVGADRGASSLVEEAVCVRHSSAGSAEVCTRESEEASFVHQTKESGLGGCMKRPLWLPYGEEV